MEPERVYKYSLRMALVGTCAFVFVSCSSSTPANVAIPSHGHGYLRAVASEIDWIELHYSGQHDLSGLFIENVGPGHAADRQTHQWNCELTGVVDGTRILYSLSSCSGAPIAGSGLIGKLTPQEFILNPGSSLPIDRGVLSSVNVYNGELTSALAKWKQEGAMLRTSPNGP